MTRFRLEVRQHAFEVRTVIVLTAVVTVTALVEAFRLNLIAAPSECTATLRYFGTFYATTLPPCVEPSRQFTLAILGADVGAVAGILSAFPFFAGLLLGVSIVADEIEHGTASLAWSLQPSRTRWLAGKLWPMLPVLLASLAAVAVAGDVLFAAAYRGMDPNAYLADLHVPRGAMVFGWGVLSFTGALALGAIIRRAAPAIVISLVCAVLALALFSTFMERQAFRSLAVMQPQIVDGAPRTDPLAQRADLLIYTMFSYNGELLDEAQRVALEQAHEGCRPYPGGTSCGVDPAVEEALQPVSFVIPASRYWEIVGLETAILVGAAAMLLGGALLVVRRRRP